MYFLDRLDAGRTLAALLQDQGFGDIEAVVLGLPRGGIPVAFEVADALGAPLDVIVVRKLGVPFQPELAMGAIGEGGARTLNDNVIAMTGMSSEDLAAVERRERAELERRAQRFRAVCSRIPLSGETVLIVDDGIATGSTARAACQVARAQGASRVVLAVPVAPPSTLYELRDDADDVICAHEAEPLWAVGQFYVDFSQTSDAEVIDLLQKAAERPREVVRERDGPSPARDEEVAVAVGSRQLGGRLTIPENPKGIVVFAHGSGSSRHSPRNRFVADELNRIGLGTLLFDLLTPDEERVRSNVFDIVMLGRRLVEVTAWLRSQPGTGDIPIGYFGASTGAAAALWAAAEPAAQISAVVSRGGRPDLAGTRLSEVQAPTLLVVGGRDEVVERLNTEAQEQLRCESHFVILPGATHLFEEPGALEQVATLAGNWFFTHFEPAAGQRGGTDRNDAKWDPALGHAREQAQGSELYEDPLRYRSRMVEQEAAQGVEVFADPDAVVPATALVEGSPGHETLTGNQAGLESDDGRNRNRNGL